MQITKEQADKVIAAMETTAFRQVDIPAREAALTIMRGLAESEPDSDDVLWLWKNGDHMLAYRSLYPCYEGGDPMVLGEPCGKAYFRQSFDRGATSPQAAQTEAQEREGGNTFASGFPSNWACW